MSAAPHLPVFLRLASDSTLAGLAGAALLLLSALALWGERRRRQRADIDAVGWVPWRDLAAITSIAALVLLALAGMGWLRG